MQRLSGQDASFLYAEVPTAPLHVGFLAVFDPPQDGAPYDAVRRQVAARLPRLPLLRRRVVPVPLQAHHPVLVDDPAFDLDAHLHRRAVPAPGTTGELAAVAAELLTGPLDRARPLWEVHVLEGLEQGGFALFIKVHHAVIDGVSGMELLSTLLTPEPQPDPPQVPAPWRPEPLPSPARLAAEAAVDLVRAPLRVTATVVERTGERLRRFVRVAPTAPTMRSAPRSPLNGRITARRSVALVPLPLEAARTVKAAFGTTLNDVVLAVVGGALRRWLADRAALPGSSLVAMAPVSVRRPSEAGTYGNRVSAIFVPLGTDLPDPVARLRAVHAATSSAKELHEAVAVPELMDWNVLAGPATMALAARLYSATNLADVARPAVNLVVSNVPGPRTPLHCGSARLRALHPFGPLGEGLGLNVSLVSYGDTLHVGLVACPDLVPDVQRVGALLAEELATLEAAAR